MSVTKRDRIIDAMWQNLPTKSVEDLRHDVEIDLGEDVSYASLAQTMTYLRKHCDKYGWTLPHAKRGPNSFQEERIFGIELSKPNLTPAQRGHAEDGARATLLSIMSQSRNQAATLEAMMKASKPKLASTLKKIRNEQLHIANLAETALEDLAA